MKRIHARTLLAYESSDLWDMLIGKFILVMDDGELETTDKEVIYSHYFWTYHKEYPTLPILKRHHVSHVLNGSPITTDTHAVLLSVIYKDAVSSIPGMDDPNNRDRITRLVYIVTNRLYNDFVSKAGAWITSIDILDFIELLDHPPISEANANIKPTQESIGKTYDVVINSVTKSPELKNNTITKLLKSKLVNRNQVLQCISARGVLTDISSINFNRPVLVGYAQGMRSMYDMMVESRSCAKALFFAEQPLQDTEYFARRLQLLAMSVETVHYTDCGSTEYLSMNVKGPTYDERGNLISKGDLGNLIGKFYWDDVTQTLKAVEITDSHLFGKTVKFRSMVAGCKHPNPAGVCYVCFGKLADNLIPGTNIGHASAGTLNSQISQNVLSTKHLDGSAILDGIILSADAQPFFTVNQDQSTYHLNGDLLRTASSVRMIVSDKSLFGLNDIHHVTNVRDISTSRLSKIDYVSVEVTTMDGNIEIYPVLIEFKGRYGMFTHEFLDFIKHNKWTVDRRNNAIFDITTLDPAVPIMALPDKQYSMSDHSACVASIIESRIMDLTDRGVESSAAGTLVELFDTVNDKLNINLSLLDLLIYSAMVVDGNGNDYRLTKPWTSKGLGVTSRTIPNRSLGGAYAYEDVYAVLTKPKSFYAFNRPDHPMDVYSMPEETVADFK